MDAEKSRLEQFKEFVELDPTDTFSRYALGMEYLGTSEYSDALQQFQEVIRLQPDDPAAYSQAALAAENLHQVDEARLFLQKGIEAATKKGDKHTREEMEAALEKLDK
jgi:Tfp pilus assembly protein PilF